MTETYTIDSGQKDALLIANIKEKKRKKHSNELNLPNLYYISNKTVWLISGQNSKYIHLVEAYSCCNFSSLQWSFSCFSCRFCSTGAYSDYTRPYLLIQHMSQLMAKKLKDKCTLSVKPVKIQMSTFKRTLMNMRVVKIVGMFV